MLQRENRLLFLVLLSRWRCYGSTARRGSSHVLTRDTTHQLASGGSKTVVRDSRTAVGKCSSSLPPYPHLPNGPSDHGLNGPRLRQSNSTHMVTLTRTSLRSAALGLSPLGISSFVRSNAPRFRIRDPHTMHDTLLQNTKALAATVQI